ncbi:MAG TPA: 2Fe-2S iron-sulfur cluster binding domain-containing protein [Dongiaceae bacterium]|nr:2Fe-2S iron-sulfur cluster binding domain-containing protein [Dongiaceae bacterium]
MSHRLTIEPTGEQVDVAERQTILDACLRAGVWLPHACGHGLCGTCKVDVIDGEVDHGDASPFALMDMERAEGKALACTATMESDVTIEADIDAEPDARVIPVRDFSGTIARLEDAARDVKRLVIEVDGAGIDFQAGQHVALTVPGVAGARPFSLASAPSQPNRIELQVRLVPGGAATTAIHRDLRPGQRLSFAGPYGRFFVRKSAGGPLLFLAGGTGVSSPKAMVLDLLEGGWADPITLIHGVRQQADLYDRDLFEDLAARHRNLRYVPALSQEPEGSDWPGARGFVHEVAARLHDGMFAGQTAYLCGPPPMIEACIRTLMQGRLFEKHIFTERFLTAQDGAERRSPVFKRL